MIDAQTLALAAQDLGCLAPSARHLCSTGLGIAFSSVRCGIFWNGRKMSLLTELVFQHTRNSTYMPALTGLRLSGKSGQIRPKLKRQAKIKPKSNRFKPKNRSASRLRCTTASQAGAGSLPCRVEAYWRKRACRVEAKRRRINDQTVIAAYCQPLPAFPQKSGSATCH